jgi:hypothetical protein
LDGSTVPIFHTSAAKGEDIDYMDAGGGVVAMGIERAGENPDHTAAPLETEIVRINRDGTGQQVLSTATQRPEDDFGVVIEKGKPKLDDCGAWVELDAVSTTGEVFYAHDDQERESAACGGNPNMNKWSFIGVALDGTPRTVLTTAAPIHSHFKVFKHGGITGSCDCGAAGHRDLSIAGDWALVRSYSNTAVLNLSTGAISGPYVQADIPKSESSDFSINTAGQVVAHGISVVDRGKRAGKRARYKNTVRTTLFPVPGDPTTSVRVAGDPYAIACGDNIYSVKVNKAKIFSVTQLDPATGADARVVGQFSGKSGFGVETCGANQLYVARQRGPRTIYRDVPLG